MSLYRSTVVLKWLWIDLLKMDYDIFRLMFTAYKSWKKASKEAFIVHFACLQGLYIIPQSHLALIY